jgi:transposase
MPRTRTEMRRIREVLRLKFQLGLNDSQVSRSTGIARSTVQEYLQRVTGAGLDAEQLLALNDAALERRLFPSRELRDVDRPLPEWEMVERELRRRGVTLRLLWLEYLAGQPDGYQYTQYVGDHISPSSSTTLGCGNARHVLR